MSTDMLLAYIAIGFGVAIATSMWPFRQGAVGIVVRTVAAVGGAVGFAALSHGIMPGRRPVHLLVAVAGALLVSLAAQGLWFWTAARAHREARHASR